MPCILVDLYQCFGGSAVTAHFTRIDGDHFLISSSEGLLVGYEVGEEI
jgi:hypothetical protein